MSESQREKEQHSFSKACYLPKTSFDGNTLLSGASMAFPKHTCGVLIDAMNKESGSWRLSAIEVPKDRFLIYKTPQNLKYTFMD